MPRDGALREAQGRLRRLLAEFKLHGGFDSTRGRQLWGDVQQTVREINDLHSGAGAENAPPRADPTREE